MYPPIRDLRIAIFAVSRMAYGDFTRCGEMTSKIVSMNREILRRFGLRVDTARTKPHPAENMLE